MRIVKIIACFLLAASHSLMQASAEAATNAQVIQVKVQHNRVLLPLRINGSEPLTFLLDSACTITTIHPELADELKLQRAGFVRITGIAGEERAPMFRGAVFDFGPASYSPRRVASLGSEREHSRRRRDGVLGSGFFEQFVLELDVKTKTLRLHSPTNFTYTGPGKAIPFRFKDEIPVVEGTIEIPEQAAITAEFEIDTGCDSGICLGDHFVKKHNLLEAVESKSSEKFGIGGSVDTKSGALPLVRLGGVEIRNAQTDFFLDGSPVDAPLAGHIGMGTLHNYKVFFDYSRKRIIIEP